MEAVKEISPVKIPEGFDIKTIRKDFSILDRELPNGKKLIYLDSAATTHKPEAVIKRMDEFLRTENGTVRRGLYTLSAQATKSFDNVRIQVKDFINAREKEEIIFTRGTTESINLVASSFGQAFVKAGDEILISAIEHHSNIVPWQLLCDRTGASLKIIPVKDNGELDLAEYEKLLSEKVKIIALTHISNSLGTINPIKEMIATAHSKNIPVLIDGAQGIQHSDVDVQDLDADFYAFSAHKLYAPTGIGVLYGKREWLDKMPPYHGGGEMISKVTFEKTTYAEIPFKFEAGTPAIVEVIGLGAAIDYIKNIGLEKIQAYEADLLRYLDEKLKNDPEIKGLRVIGEAKNKAALISMSFDCAEPFDIAVLLNEHGVAVRSGHHCAQPVMDRFKVDATLRASLAFYNTQDDIDRFIKALKEVLQIFVP